MPREPGSRAVGAAREQINKMLPQKLLPSPLNDTQHECELELERRLEEVSKAKLG